MFDVSMKAAVGPIGDTRNVSVFDGVKVDVIDMPLEIDIVADRMLPKTAPPDSLLAFDNFAR